MAIMSGPNDYPILLDDAIVKAATEAANDEIDNFAKQLSADFAAAAVPPEESVEEYSEEVMSGYENDL